MEKLRLMLHYARKKEQRVWGSGSEHEAARAEVERLEALVSKYEAVPRDQPDTRAGNTTGRG